MNLLKITENKLVFLIFLIKNDSALLKDCGFLKNDNNSLGKDFKTILMEQREEYLDNINSEEEAVIERFLDE